jgi:hypothetical protein
MGPRVSLRTFSAVVLFLLLLASAIAKCAFCQEIAAGFPDLGPEARARLSAAAKDTLLPPWQREFMLRTAREGMGQLRDLERAGARASVPERASAATDGSWEELIIGGRSGASAVYDPARDRMVVFGGGDRIGRNDVWALSLAGTPAWTALMPTGTAPSVRGGHRAIYDPVRDRMVVFGGYDGSYRNDVWVLTLAGPPAWTELTPAGTPPRARSGHSAVYDPVRDRMVVFGGFSGSSYCNDTWTLALGGTPTWTMLAPTDTLPSARDGHSTIYDPVRDRMVVFGGYDGSYRNDVWVLTLAGTPAWTALMPTGTVPSIRAGHSAIYDPVRDRLVVFGGHDSSYTSFKNDVWALSIAGAPTWTLLTPTSTPPTVRSFHTAIYDPVRDCMVAFAGSYYDGTVRPQFLNDTWTLSLANIPTWTVLTPTATPPSTRTGHSAVYDPVRDRMVVFGGTSTDGGYHYLNDVWSLSLGGAPAWTALAPTGTPPSARDEHSAIYDPNRDRMVVFGGHDDSNGYHNDVWALSLAGTPAWTALMPTGAAPSVRGSHSAIYDPERDRMVVFGGTSADGGYHYLNDVWSLSLGGAPAWTTLTPTGTPPRERSGHSAIYDRDHDRMVVFGGEWHETAYSHGPMNDVWMLSLAAPPAWSQSTPADTPPSPRGGHSAIYDPVRDRMVVFGGTSADGGYHFLNDVWALSLGDTPTWTALAPIGTSPCAREGHSATYAPLRNRMVVFGGGYGYGNRNDVLALEWSTPVDVGGRDSGPLVSCLRPPVPNPSGAMMTVSYAIAKAGRVQLSVYDVRGRLVRGLVDGERPPQAETVVWDGTGDSGTRMGAGVYFVRLVGPGIQAVRQAVLLK